MAIPPFAHVAAASYLVPAAAGLRSWKLRPKAMKVFALYSLYSVLHLAAEFILGRMGISNQFLLNIQQIAELLCLLYLYDAWTPDPRSRSVFRIFAVGYTVFWAYTMVNSAAAERFSEGSSIAAMLVLMTASVMVLNTLVRSSRETVTAHAIFWIATGVLLYGAGTVIITGFSNTILAMGMEYFNALWHINWGFTIVTNLFYARSFTCKLF